MNINIKNYCFTINNDKYWFCSKKDLINYLLVLTQTGIINDDQRVEIIMRKLDEVNTVLIID